MQVARALALAGLSAQGAAPAQPLAAKPGHHRARAKRIIEFYKEAESKGAGAISMYGFVVDRPVYVRALALLEQAGQKPTGA